MQLGQIIWGMPQVGLSSTDKNKSMKKGTSHFPIIQIDEKKMDSKTQ